MLNAAFTNSSSVETLTARSSVGCECSIGRPYGTLQGSGVPARRLESAAQGTVADPVAGTGTAGGRAVVGIREPAAIEREAAAADAFREAVLEALELGDPLIDPRG